MKRNILIIAIIMALMLQNVSALAPLQASEFTEKTTTDNITIENTSVISEELQEAFLTNEESYRVMIWIDDIDYDKVETMAEKATATTWEEIEAYKKQVYADAITEVAQAELAEKTSAGVNTVSALRSNEEIMEDNYEAVLKAADDDLKLVAAEVDEFIAAKRAASKSLYQINNQELVKNNIIKENLEFVSSYSPMVIANLTQEEIEAIAKDKEVFCIYLLNEENDIDIVDKSLQSQKLFSEISNSVMASSSNDYEGYLDYINATPAHGMGYTGDGVNVGLIDRSQITNSYHAELSSSNIINYGSPSYSGHSVDVARVIAGTYGVAPDCNLFTIHKDFNFFNGIETLIDSGVSVINISFGINRYESSNLTWYSAREMWLDHVSASHSVVVVVAAGNAYNNSWYVSDPALAYNVIAVADVDYKNDVIFEASCYNNGSTGAKKPDVASSGNGVLGMTYDETDEESVGGGTSAAAATVTGMIAILLEVDPTLTGYPHIVKAIVIASADHVANGTLPTSGYNNKQGAGVIDVMRAITIINRGTYWGSYISSNGTYNYTKTIVGGESQTTFVYNGTKMNICSGNHGEAEYNNQDMPNVTIIIMNQEGTTGYGGCSMPYSSVQIARINYVSTVQIRLMVNNIGTRGLPYAVAWY